MAAAEHFALCCKQSDVGLCAVFQHLAVLLSQGGSQYEFARIVQHASGERLVLGTLIGMFENCNLSGAAADCQRVVGNLLYVVRVQHTTFKLLKYMRR